MRPGRRRPNRGALLAALAGSTHMSNNYQLCELSPRRDWMTKSVGIIPRPDQSCRREYYTHYYCYHVCWSFTTHLNVGRLRISRRRHLLAQSVGSLPALCTPLDIFTSLHEEWRIFLVEHAASSDSARKRWGKRSGFLEHSLKALVEDNF
eukprot:scaffold434133_cov35-Prasinocladus_malaysianus.AAC.1